MSKLYTERDIIEQGDYYSRHTSAMTGEDLHSKSDIAAELAHRDIEIDKLKARVAAQQSALNSICTCSWGAAEFFDVGKAASWMQKIAYDALDEVPSTEAFILRKQAEAVQASRQAVSVPDAWCVVTNDDQIQYTSMVDKNLGLPIEQSHDYAWQQCNEVIQEWIEIGLDAASKYVIRPIALLATPTKADDWIKCSERLPAEYDGDFEGLVWVNDRDMTLPKYAQSRVHWSRVRAIAGYTHWMPTGFRRPQPPKQEGE